MDRLQRKLTFLNDIFFIRVRCVLPFKDFEDIACLPFVDSCSLLDHLVDQQAVAIPVVIRLSFSHESLLPPVRLVPGARVVIGKRFFDSLC